MEDDKLDFTEGLLFGFLLGTLLWSGLTLGLGVL